MKKYNEKQTNTINNFYTIMTQSQEEQNWIEIAYHYSQSDDEDAKGKFELLLELILKKHNLLHNNLELYWTELKDIL